MTEIFYILFYVLSLQTPVWTATTKHTSVWSTHLWLPYWARAELDLTRHPDMTNLTSQIQITKNILGWGGVAHRVFFLLPDFFFWNLLCPSLALRKNDGQDRNSERLLSVSSLSGPHSDISRTSCLSSEGSPSKRWVRQLPAPRGVRPDVEEYQEQQLLPMNSDVPGNKNKV